MRRGAWGTQGSGTFFAYLVASHYHPPPYRAKGSRHPLVKIANRSDLKVPYLSLISSGYLNLGVETGRGHKHKPCVCLSPDWVFPVQ